MLLFFGIRTERSAVENLVGSDVLSALVGFGFLQVYDGCVQAVNYCFLPVNGKYLIGPRIFGFETSPSCPLYLGYDSFVLADAVRRETNVHFAFEVGSGTGVATLIGSQTKTVATDIDPKAVLVSSANFILNGVEDRCSVVEEDLFPTQRFGSPDLIFSNPPYVPAPQDAPLPVYSWGGEDGLEVVRRILAALPRATNQGTRCIFVLSTYGSSEETALDRLLSEVSCIYRVQLRYYRRLALEQADFEALAQGARLVDGVPGITPERFREHYANFDFRYKYDCILKVDAAGPFGLEVTSEYGSPN